MAKFSEHLAAVIAGRRPARARKVKTAAAPGATHYVGGLDCLAPCGAVVSGRVGVPPKGAIEMSTANPAAITCATCRNRLRAKWTSDLDLAQAKSTKAMDARSRLLIGSSRARVTTANANWMRAAEFRDRIAEQLAKLDEEKP